MDKIITKTMHRAANHGSIVNYYLIQFGAFDLPYGDTGAMVQAAQQEGLNVTQNDGERFLINNTACDNTTIHSERGGCIGMSSLSVYAGCGCGWVAVIYAVL